MPVRLLRLSPRWKGSLGPGTPGGCNESSTELKKDGKIVKLKLVEGDHGKSNEVGLNVGGSDGDE